MADPTVRVPRSLSLLTSARAWRGQDLADREGRSSRRHVEPHRLVCTGRRGYLVARDLDRDDWRSSRVDAPVDVVVRRVPPRSPSWKVLDDVRWLLVTGADHLDAIVVHRVLLDTSSTELGPTRAPEPVPPARRPSSHRQRPPIHRDTPPGVWSGREPDEHRHR